MSIIIFRVDVVGPKHKKHSVFFEKSYLKQQNPNPIFTFEKCTMLKK